MRSPAAAAARSASAGARPPRPGTRRARAGRASAPTGTAARTRPCPPTAPARRAPDPARAVRSQPPPRSRPPAWPPSQREIGSTCLATLPRPCAARPSIARAQLRRRRDSIAVARRELGGGSAGFALLAQHAEAGELLVQRAARDAEADGGALDVVVLGLVDPLDVAALELGEREVLGGDRGAGAADGVAARVEAELADADHGTVGEQDGALEQVAQLAQVAGPLVVDQGGERGAGDAHARAAELGADAVEQAVDE